MLGREKLYWVSISENKILHLKRLNENILLCNNQISFQLDTCTLSLGTHLIRDFSLTAQIHVYTFFLNGIHQGRIKATAEHWIFSLEMGGEIVNLGYGRCCRRVRVNSLHHDKSLSNKHRSRHCIVVQECGAYSYFCRHALFRSSIQ